MRGGLHRVPIIHLPRDLPAFRLGCFTLDNFDNGLGHSNTGSPTTCEHRTATEPDDSPGVIQLVPCVGNDHLRNARRKGSRNGPDTAMMDDRRAMGQKLPERRELEMANGGWQTVGQLMSMHGQKDSANTEYAAGFQRFPEQVGCMHHARSEGEHDGWISCAAELEHSVPPSKMGNPASRI
jgi:hypothetical protein